MGGLTETNVEDERLGAFARETSKTKVIRQRGEQLHDVYHGREGLKHEIGRVSERSRSES